MHLHVSGVLCVYTAKSVHIKVHARVRNFHVKIIHVLNIHIDLFLWVYGTHENILT